MKSITRFPYHHVNGEGNVVELLGTSRILINKNSLVGVINYRFIMYERTGKAYNGFT